MSLIEDHMALAEWIARPFVESTDCRFAKAEIRMAAQEGLADAGRKFDPSTGYQFATYATIRIRGAIVDYFRHRAGVRNRKAPTFQDTAIIPLPAPERGEWDHEAEELLCHLNSRERDMVERYYYRGQEQSEIAAVYQLTYSRVSQILSRAIKKMRAYGSRPE